MKKRIFIVINLPDEIKRELLSYEKRWKNLRIKWTNFYKMHTTLEFLGEIDKKDINSIIVAIRSVALNIKPFDIRLDKIILGPDHVQAKMFWATLHIDTNLIKLKKLLREKLIEQNFDIKDIPFKPHITLARARGNQLKGKQTNIVLKNLCFKAKSIEIMESQLRENIEKYKSIENLEFKG